MNKEMLEKRANHIRQNIVRMVYEAKSGHPGGSLSATDILTYLYFEEMDINEKNVSGIKRDRFVLSKGHASPLLYAVLSEKGLLQEEELSGFRKIHSRLQGHPNMNYIDGVDMSTGSLGQGISAAAGMALAGKIDETPYRIYTLLGDLDNLCAIVDFNGLQIDGDVRDVIDPTPIDQKFEAFGWYVEHVNGHDFDELSKAFTKARENKGKPTMILAHTIKGKGVSFMENNYAWHGSVPNDEQYIQAMNELKEESV